ncbi:MAG: Polynucleotide adenylyltransferase region [Rhizorhabdus sp.]|nr:Polynucleotide adenylyltransferase region [Rhizorhabdus sp.]
MTRILPPTAWREREGLRELLAGLGSGEGLIRFVGGAVRDTLCGTDVKDVDCATSLAPDAVIDRIRAAGFTAVPTGILHGTVTAVIPSGPIEVTTLRHDVETDGRHAVVAFTDDWRADAARRDFTINALSADPIDGSIHDYFGGLDDLDAGIVRFIGTPLDRIAEDHLRILRFFRFHARFGRGAPDPAALAACVERANDLMALSRERIADELTKLLGVADPVATVRLMLDKGIFRPILPEIEADGVDRLARLVGREAVASVAGDPLRRLGALLPQDGSIAAGIAQRLKMSRAAARRLEQTAATSDEPPRAIAYRFGADVAIDLLLRGSARDADLAAIFASLSGWERPRLPMGGGDLISRGLKPGPVVAATLQAIERRWIAEDFPGAARIDVLKEEELARVRRDQG